jgi:hypothetical protein
MQTVAKPLSLPMVHAGMKKAHVYWFVGDYAAPIRMIIFTLSFQRAPINLSYSL